MSDASMIELVKALQARIAYLEQDNARYENARYIMTIEIDHLRRKLGYNNTHPDADKCGCAQLAVTFPTPRGQAET